MALTLTAYIDAEIRYLTVTGTVPDSIQGGYRFRLGDEALELQGFVKPQHTITVDRNRWYVRRAQDGSAAATHTTGTEVKGANDAFISATSGTTPPNPFAAPSGSGFANPATDDLDMATHAITSDAARGPRRAGRCPRSRRPREEAAAVAWVTRWAQGSGSHPRAAVLSR